MTEIKWRRTNGCANNECAEIAFTDGEVLLRNSSAPKNVIRLTPAEWRAFAAGVAAGEFDHLIP